MSLMHGKIVSDNRFGTVISWADGRVQYYPQSFLAALLWPLFHRKRK